ncbi:MAG: Gfo/Idh/MocA family oxidoreductase [Melioribacteraceae bacterium]|nr:Gfo/Idh/MocA family oxidoreductase [Melioribacteraceae bacterium]
MSKDFNRREFMGVAGLAATGLAIGLAGCGKNRTFELKPFLDQAPDGKELKAGLIGCGGRGTGAAINFLDAGPNLKIHALGDLFKDRVDGCKTKLKNEKNVEVADENCFTGFDAYEKVIDSGVDIIILATPPHFRPMQFAAAIDARKHVFMEKPVAVDPVGARSIMASSKKAEKLGLVVGTGTQRRHQRDYVTAFKQIYEGAIGEVVSANCYWNQSQLWYREPKKNLSEMENMIRDWVNWTWLSGDHIVEQHVHNIDVIHWFSEAKPVKAVGFGSRQRRVTGDQYDNFSVDFEYDNGMHMHSMSRQINGCANNVSEFIKGSKGYSNCQNKIWNDKGEVIWEYKYAKTDDEYWAANNLKVSPYVQEHIDLVTAIRNNKPYVEAEQTAISTMAAIMGRISAYTGKEVTWEEMMNSNIKLGPNEYLLGKVDVIKSVKVPGVE